jgi:hypothetical protein
MAYVELLGIKLIIVRMVVVAHQATGADWIISIVMRNLVAKNPLVIAKI